MSSLFYIGIILELLSLIPLVIINGKMNRDRKEYERLPSKMEEIRADYRRKRFTLGLFQLGCIAIAIIGLLA